MHKSQSNVTIAMTEFDNLRELNAYAIDIARDYFAMAANDPRREETAREILRLSRRRSLMERAVSALPPPQHRILLPKKRESKTESLGDGSGPPPRKWFSLTMNGRRLLPNLPVREIEASSP
jgi:hypothetical protein